MYEKFSDRARKVMQLANRVAQEWNHEYIGTEHILLGLLRMDDGIGPRVLRQLLPATGALQSAVEALIQRGPEMITMGKLPQTPRAKKVIESAMDEARQLGHSHVGTEHILLGLLREGEGVASQEMQTAGLTLEGTRAALVEYLGPQQVASEINKAAFLIRGQAAFSVKDGCGVESLFRADSVQLADGVLSVNRNGKVIAQYSDWTSWREVGEEWTAMVAVAESANKETAA